MGMMKKISLALITIGLLVSQPLAATDTERRQAKRIHDRLTGIIPSNATIDAMEALLAADVNCPAGPACGKSAAEFAINRANNLEGARGFYNVTLKNFVAPWTNEEQTVFTPLNDYIATAIGLIRDGADFRRLLHDDVIYHANATVGPNYSNSNNTHYEQLEALGPVAGDLSNNGILVADTQSSPNTAGHPFNATAGVMTSRAGAMAFFSDGTNRAMFRFTMMNHLCTDLEPLKDVSRINDRVRRDVSRSPGGDSRIFLNGCVGCHAGMDGMAGAFAFYEWNYVGDKTTGSLGYTEGVVSGKHNINPDTFEQGYITTDNSWVNYWRTGPNSILANRPLDVTPAWNPTGGPLPGVTVDPIKKFSSGIGAKSLGVELANSRAFAQCQVDKAFKAICLRDPNVFSADRDERDGFVSNFIGNGYDMREVFTDVGAYCKGS